MDHRYVGGLVEQYPRGERLPTCNPAAAPGKFQSEIQEIDFDDLANNLLNAIESARTINPHIDTALYYRGHIQTLAFDNNAVYVCGPYTMNRPELVTEYLNDNLRAGVNIIELDPFDGVEYHPPTAPPKPTRRTLTTTWASMKQK